MDNPKVTIKESKLGKGLFAISNISAGEEIASFDGQYYGSGAKIYGSAGTWSEDSTNHTIQIAQHCWRDSTGFARYANHSCDPNCGIKELWRIVSMRDIHEGEEITWDFEMTEDNTRWIMECKCGTPICRKKIGAFRNMPEETRIKYKGYISGWLVDKYKVVK